MLDVVDELRFHVIRNEKISILFDPLTYDIYELTPSQAELFETYEFWSRNPKTSNLQDSFLSYIARFLREDFCRLEGTKLREKYDSRKISNLVINVSQTCNLRCMYCYARGLNEAGKVMEKDTAEHVLQTILPLSGLGLNSVKFLGGEPLVNFEVIRFIVNRTKSLCEEFGLKLPEFVLVTNGTLVTKPHIEFFKNNDIFVIVSLDGPKKIHDELRPKASGLGSFEKVISAIVGLVENDIQVGIESTYTSMHEEMQVTPLQMVRFFESLGVHYFAVQPVAGTWHGLDVMPYLENIAKQFRKVVRYCIYSLTSRCPSLLLNNKFTLESIARKEKKAYICGAGRDFLTVNYDGEVYPCYLLESPATYIGNVLDDIWTPEKLMKATQPFWDMSKDNDSACARCWAKEICNSCHGSSFLVSHKLEMPPKWFCDFSREQIEETLLCLAEIRKSPTEWRVLTETLEDVYLKGTHRTAGREL